MTKPTNETPFNIPRFLKKDPTVETLIEKLRRLAIRSRQDAVVQVGRAPALVETAELYDAAADALSACRAATIEEAVQAASWAIHDASIPNDDRNLERRSIIVQDVAKAIRSLSASAGPGYAVRPREPSDDMLRAGHSAMFVDVKYSRAADIVKRGYKAMFDAAMAASPPTPKEGA